ncbi:ABC transporter permease [Demequina sp. NBRC 110053]|uniref:ABC transporter permease n=1 Tax=Demequina sp. NBRC 110053 TaxID=1570342 RepID=UPI000A025284|nr:iron chelate uptake ABC transporter family permease subunit [Demequina sp. NBRC 110053]
MRRPTPDTVAAVAPWAAVALVVVLGAVSMAIGVIDLGALDGPEARELILTSRLPRTAALILAGASMAVAGLIMQHLAQNRFVAPTTAGTVDAAAVGLLVATLLFTGAAVITKVAIALVFALAGTALFVLLTQRIQFKDMILVPLLGLVLAGVYRAGAEFFAFRAGLTQALDTWFNADFSGIIEGRYETLWLAGLAAAGAYLFANRFTAAGMGEAFATNIGVNYRLVMSGGLGIAALATAVVVVTVGAIPFLGLIVPNIVTLVLGDNLRRVLPVTALVGASLVLVCDIVGRVLIFPYEISMGLIVGVVGSAVFLAMVMRKGNRYATT